MKLFTVVFGSFTILHNLTPVITGSVEGHVLFPPHRNRILRGAYQTSSSLIKSENHAKGLTRHTIQFQSDWYTEFMHVECLEANNKAQATIYSPDGFLAETLELHDKDDCQQVPDYIHPYQLKILSRIEYDEMTFTIMFLFGGETPYCVKRHYMVYTFLYAAILERDDPVTTGCIYQLLNVDEKGEPTRGVSNLLLPAGKYEIMDFNRDISKEEPRLYTIDNAFDHPNDDHFKLECRNYIVKVDNGDVSMGIALIIHDNIVLEKLNIDSCTSGSTGMYINKEEKLNSYSKLTAFNLVFKTTDKKCYTISIDYENVESGTVKIRRSNPSKVSCPKLPWYHSTLKGLISKLFRKNKLS